MLVVFGFIIMNNIQAFENYLRHEKKYSAHTVTAYMHDINEFDTFIKEEFEEPEIKNINYSLVRSWIVLLVENGLNNVSVNRKIASLKAFFKFLQKIKQIEANPFSQHKALKTEKKIQIPFSEEELKTVLNKEIDESDFEDVRDKLIVELFYVTGMRRAELISLKIKDINLETKTLRVLGKRNKERIIPILPLLIESIKKYEYKRTQLQQITDLEYFFLSKNGVKISETFVYRMINSYFSNVSKKVKKSPHVLRHTFATHLLNNGAGINSVKELLGHASLASTQVYTHSSLAELKKAYGAAHPRNKK